jgi:hypothetical protein
LDLFFFYHRLFLELVFSVLFLALVFLLFLALVFLL